MTGAISSSSYMSTIARRLAWRAWWLPVLALAVIAYGAATDVRVAILGLMLLFIIYPMIMSFTIMRYATLPHLAERTLANRFEIDGDSIRISHIETDEESGRETVRELGCFRISAISHSGQRLVFNTGNGMADIILAPVDAIDPAALAKLESDLNEGDFIAHDDN